MSWKGSARLSRRFQGDLIEMCPNSLDSESNESIESDELKEFNES